MNDLRPALHKTSLFAAILLAAAFLCAGLPALGLVAPQSPGRFSALGIADPSSAAAPAPLAAVSSAAGEAAARGWGQYRLSYGDQWEIYLDARSGAPMLVQGQGIPWFPGSGNSLAYPAAESADRSGAPKVAIADGAAGSPSFGSAPAVAGPVNLESLASSLRAFVAQNASLLLADDGEMTLNSESSGNVAPDRWVIGFDRRVENVPVAGDRYLFYIGQGNLVAFGASRWSKITTSPVPSIDPAAARALLYKYMGLSGTEAIELVEPGTLAFTPVAAPGTAALDYAGPVGGGYSAVLTWRIALRVEGESETWAGLVDAHTGAIVAFNDDNKYAQVKGGILPVSNDGQCPDGCEQGNYPMPFATVTIGSSPTNANSAGIFTCAPAGGTGTTSLSGPYVRVSDACGAISQSVTCDADLNLGTSSGTDCTVPAGASAGNTRAARTGFYHLNRIKEHARAWLPSNSWLGQQLTDNVNINLTCNGFWNGSTVNFYRSGGGCRNTGEIAAVFLHEWGHGLDANDGGSYDNPTEAYADVTSFLSTHASCIGRGFRQSGTCGGYGNACLTCTGVRESDWTRRSNNLPSTPEGFISTCPSGGSSGGPCGKETHCEGYLMTETLWDLATRDLPASGLDQTTAWVLLDRMWYLSRPGSGGNIYTCGSPASSRSCSVSSWFSQLRTADDDDGNLANGTPHAAAIFAAFNRHGIPCGLATDASNLSHTSCPALGTPVLSALAGPGTASLSWGAVAGASSYAVLRNDQGCGWGFTLASSPSGTAYNDTGLANGFPEYYAVQAVGTNPSCRGAVSNCIAVTPSGSGADLSVTMTDSPDPVTPGQNITYTLTVLNTGALAAASVQLGGSTPANTTFQSMTWPAGWSCTAPAVGATGPIDCSVPSLNAGGQAGLTIVVRTNLCLGNGSSISNTVSVSTSTADTNLSNNSATAATTISSAGCDDANLCTTDTCVPATGCVHTAVSCDDGNACTTDLCSVVAGCLHPAVSCNDSNACTTDTCSPATGCVRTALNCNDNNPCTDDSCSPASGCVRVNNSGSCSDGNACTTNDLCSAGTCVGGPAPSCGDGDACTVDSCSPATGCTHAAVSCDDGNVCTADTCSPVTGCAHANTTAPCDDGDPCTVGDACSGGACSAGAPAPPPAEVNDSVRVTKAGATATISWSDGPGSFNVYRGSDSSPASWTYNQSCMISLITGPTIDASAPPAASTFYYLVTRRTSCGESIPGRSSAGAPIPNASPCP